MFAVPLYLNESVFLTFEKTLLHFKSLTNLRSKFNEMSFFPDSSIPVGIAIGRQRHQDGASSLAAAAAEKKRITAETSDPMPDQAYPAVPTAPSSPWGVSVPPGPHSGPSVYPSTSPFGSAPPHWMPPHGMPHPMGPIPMGYQLAKDPLTGQMLLIPTGNSAVYTVL